MGQTIEDVVAATVIAESDAAPQTSNPGLLAFGAVALALLIGYAITR